METELLKAGFIVLAIILFVTFNFATSKEFRKQILNDGLRLKNKNPINIKKG